MKIPGMPDVADELAQFRDELTAIRIAVEKLVEIEEQK